MSARRDRRVGRSDGIFSGGGSSLPLSITTLSPDIGFTAAAGTTPPFLLTVTGPLFLGTETFTINGSPVVTPTFVDPTTVTFYAPAMPAGVGDYDVVVTRGARTFTLTAGYAVEPMLNVYRADVWTAPSWTELTGAGRHAVQATGASQPIQQASTINGLPGITGDGVDDSMLATTAINSATHQTYVAMRANANTPGNEGIRCLLGVAATGDNNSPNSGVLFRGGVNLQEFSSPNLLCSTVGPANGVGAMVEDLYDGANNVIRVNATTGTPVGQNTVMNIDRINLFSRWIGGVPAIWGQYTICELWFGPLSTAAKRTRIRRRFANRYNQANFI